MDAESRLEALPVLPVGRAEHTLVARTALGLGWVALVALAAWSFLYQLGEGSLYDWDEATYGQIAREMARSGDWLTPSWNGHFFFDKPPLLFWMMSFGLDRLAPPELAVRLPPALFGLFAVLVTAWLGERMVGKGAGLVAGTLLLLSSTHFSSNFLGLARQGMMDAPLTAMTVWAAAHFWLGLENRRHWYWMGVPLGLAFMIRSFSAATPFAMVGVTALLLPLMGHRLNGKEVRALAGGFLVAAVVILPWHVAMVARHGGAFLSDYVGWNLFGKATSSADGLTGEWHYYLRVLHEGLPGWWVLLVPALLFAAWQLRTQRNAHALLLLVWTLVPLLLYTVAVTKLAWYILPIYPALALLVAWLLHALVGRTALLQLLLPAAILVGASLWNYRGIEPLHLSWAVESTGWCAVNATPADETIAFFDPPRSYQSDQRDFWNIRPSVRFYADRPMVALWDRASVEGWLAGGGRFVWTNAPYVEQIGDLFQVVHREDDQVLLRRADWADAPVAPDWACHS